MPRRPPDRFVEVLARYSYPHARAIETAVGSAERFEALTLADQWLRGYMAGAPVVSGGDVVTARSGVLAALADLIGSSEIRAAFDEGTCEACGGELEPLRVRFCLSCNEDILAGVVFPWVE